MFPISSSWDLQQDPWSHNFMRVMSRVFWCNQNFEHFIVVDLRSMHLITSSLRLINTTSSRKRPATLSSHKLYTQCFTSCHHVISNKLHDLTTLCASCHECFDYIKTLTRPVVDLRSLNLDTSSLRLVNNTSPRKRPATLSYYKLYTSCFTSRHHVITNKIHDLTTLCASCHECFDYIKTLLPPCRRSYRSLHHNTLSLRLAPHRCRHASVMQLNASSQKITRISIVDRFNFFKSLKL